MNEAVLELVHPGLGASLQDLGRRGWKRFGVPPGGALDDHAARWANLLLDNPLGAPVLELLLHGAILRALCRVEVALTGASARTRTNGRWRAWVLEAGEQLAVPPPPSGLWTYVAVRGGFVGPRWFGSVSVYPRGGLGESLAATALLFRPVNVAPSWPAGIGQRWVDPEELRDYASPPPLRVWPGPQWDLFADATRDAFFAQPWRISVRSDRTGYRLEGASLVVNAVSLPSEPVLPGSIQVPPDGRPIVTMRDGPTVGGYPKLGLVDPYDLAWFSQCSPHQEVRFLPVNPAANLPDHADR